VAGKSGTSMSRLASPCQPTIRTSDETITWGRPEALA
jgi:hypothetical protein